MEEQNIQKQTDTEEISKNFINLEKVIADKNPRLLKLIPRFIIRYLKRVIHQEEINAAIYKYRDRMGVDFVNAILFETFKIDFEEIGKENIPKKTDFCWQQTIRLAAWMVGSERRLWEVFGLMFISGKRPVDAPTTNAPPVYSYK